MLGHKTTKDEVGLGKTGSDGGPARRRWLWPALVVATVCALVSVVVAVDYWSNSGRVLNGVSVGGTDLGGTTPEEARAVVGDVMQERVGEIPIVGGPQDAAVTGAEIGVAYDPAAIADEAYGVGRTGNVFERIGGRVSALSGGVEVETETEYRQDLVAEQVAAIATRVDEEPREATANVEGAEVVVGESREGYRADVPATMVEVQRAVEEATGEARMVGEALAPAVTTAEAERAAQVAGRAMDAEAVLTTREQRWTLSPEEIGSAITFTPERDGLRAGLDREALREALSDVYDDLAARPVEAGYQFRDGRVVVTPGKEGREIEEERLFGAISGGLFEGVREYEVPLGVARPELTTERAEQLKPTELLGKYRTDYTLTSDQSEERVENLRIASDAVGGTFLAPDETFSMNDTVSSLDYNATKVIIDGKEEKADGGGLCQVTSTLYMAANFAGLDVVERHPHASQLPYIRPGLDATVWFGDVNGQPLDMKFENTTDGYLLLREYVADDGYVYAEIWGQPNGTTVEMNSESTLMSNEQSKWTTYQKVTRDGKVVYDGVLHTDTYDVLIDEKGKKIPLPIVNVPPVNP